MFESYRLRDIWYETNQKNIPKKTLLGWNDMTV